MRRGLLGASCIGGGGPVSTECCVGLGNRRRIDVWRCGRNAMARPRSTAGRPRPGAARRWRGGWARRTSQGSFRPGAQLWSVQPERRVRRKRCENFPSGNTFPVGNVRTGRAPLFPRCGRRDEPRPSCDSQAFRHVADGSLARPDSAQTVGCSRVRFGYSREAPMPHRSRAWCPVVGAGLGVRGREEDALEPDRSGRLGQRCPATPSASLRDLALLCPAGAAARHHGLVSDGE